MEGSSFEIVIDNLLFQDNQADFEIKSLSKHLMKFYHRVV